MTPLERQRDSNRILLAALAAMNKEWPAEAETDDIFFHEVMVPSDTLCDAAEQYAREEISKEDFVGQCQQMVLRFREGAAAALTRARARRAERTLPATEAAAPSAPAPAPVPAPVSEWDLEPLALPESSRQTSLF